MSIRNQVENRYTSADWEIDPDSWLWHPSTKLALLGDGYGTTKARTSGPGGITATLSGGGWARDSWLQRSVYAGTTQSQYITLSSGIRVYGFSCWFYPTTLNNYNMLCGSTTSGDLIAIRSSVIEVRGDVATKTWSYTPTLNTWNHFTFAARATGASIYINAVEIGSAQATGELVNIDRIASYSSTTLFAWVGKIADVVISSSARTLPQIRQLASRRPDLGGLIRSRRVLWPVATAGGSSFKPYWAAGINTYIGVA